MMSRDIVDMSAVSCTIRARTGPCGESCQLIDSKNVQGCGWIPALDRCRRFRQSFRQLTIITTLIESLTVCATSNLEREPSVIHERRAYNRGDDIGRAFWSSATGIEGHFQHRRS